MRDQFLAAVTARLRRIEAAQDFALALEPGALDDARRLTEIPGVDDSDVEAQYVLGWFHWYRYRALPQGQGHDVLHNALQAFSCCIAHIERLPEPRPPVLAEAVASPAVRWLEQAMRTVDPTLIRATESLWRQIVNATSTGHPNRVMYLANLSCILNERCNREGTPADLDEAVTVGRAAVQATPAEYPGRAQIVNNLSSAVQMRFERAGAPADLDEALTLRRSAVQGTSADHPNRAMYLSNLGSALRIRFEQAGVRADLDEAITIGRAAVQATPADHPNRALYLSNLGIALQMGFERVGVRADLDEAITVGRAAVQAIPASHPGRGMFLSNLARALRVRFERTGTQADLDEAISIGRVAMQATSSDDPNQHICLSSLAAALQMRFDREGAQADLDEAITIGRAVVQATSSDHPNRGMYLSNLGVSVRMRFERAGAQADLDEAISIGRASVLSTPSDHPNRGMYLSNLGLAARRRFERAGTQADLDEAITVGRAAVHASPSEHPNRAMYLSNLVGVVLMRFERTGARADLDEAITVGRAAVHAIASDHPNRATPLRNLAIALQMRFERVGKPADLDEAFIGYAQAAELVSAPPSVRIHAAMMAAFLASQDDTSRAAGLLETAVRLLPETASRRLDRGDQQYALEEFAGLASDAAALALADEADPSGGYLATRALRLLELGRGVMLSQTLDTRSDIADLQARHPAIADRFIQLRDQFDQASDAPVLIDDVNAVVGREQRQVADRQQLAAAFEATVTEIRGLDGFEMFLLPPEPDQLIRHAEHGPIVVVNVSRYRSDAILIRPEGITSVPLPDLVGDTLIDRINSFHEALDTAHDPDVSSDQREGAQDTLNVTLEWLWDAAARPILDELGYRHTPVLGTAWPRLWWVPGGLLGFLPLHAAGYHREPEGVDGRPTVMDRVVSSYTPTVRALGYARERNTASAAAERALIVAMPTTPGVDSPLRHVAREAELVHARLSGSALLIEDPAITDAQSPTKANVLAQLGNCAIAHFACHGSSHPVDPSQNLLLLHDHDSDPLTVASLAPIRLDQARLAYLSACRTAFNPSTDLIDEAIHLTTAFQLAGYPHVVGTLWEIDDALAVRVADTFYTALVTGDNTIDTRGAAQALHHAVRAIRDELTATPSLWAAYLHAGA